MDQGWQQPGLSPAWGLVMFERFLVIFAGVLSYLAVLRECVPRRDILSPDSVQASSASPPHTLVGE